MRWQLLVVVALIGAGSACGEDAPPPPPPKPGGAGAKKPAAKGGKGQKTLQPRMHVEDRVECPSVLKATGPACNPTTPSCGEGLYCLPVGNAHHCEPCPERDTIRHEFKDRDFVADQVRDPFQSFIVPPKGLESTDDKKIEGPCNRADQFVATSYSYLDLRLVGIVSKGTQRKALMMDRANYGHIIRRGDCVGKEKAVVKEIGTGYITFVVQPDSEDKTPNRIPEERSIQLHPKGLQIAPQPTPDPGAGTSAPIVAPPADGAPGGATAPIVPPPSN